MSYQVISQQTWQPANQWEYPGVYLWYGYYEATQNDVDELHKFCKGGGYSNNPNEPIIERGTMKGRLALLWHSRQHPLDEEGERAGGIRSRIYENQIVDPIPSKDAQVPDNVRFRDEDDPMWYKDSEGNDVHGVPPNSGAYHEAHIGDGYYDFFEGPRPDSEAERLLGSGRYVWDDKALLWRVEG